MDFPKDQIDELTDLYGEASSATEGVFPYILIMGLQMPEGCTPVTVDGLLCPVPRDGYPARLYFSEMIDAPSAPFKLNWNGSNAFILGRKWHAFSLNQFPEGLRLAQIVAVFLKALRKP
jgi:hypothetical protein